MLLRIYLTTTLATADKGYLSGLRSRATALVRFDFEGRKMCRKWQNFGHPSMDARASEQAGGGGQAIVSDDEYTYLV